MKEKIKREKWIDYTKLFACFLVVLGHLLQGLKKANICWNENLYYYINSLIYIFHMPLFMCLSGYLYAKTTRITNKKEYFIFVKKKFMAFSIPYVVFYFTYVILNIICANNTNSKMGYEEICNIFVKPIAPFWFLYALFFIFITVPIIEKICKDKKEIVFFIFVFLHIMNLFLNTNIYAIDIVFEYGVYFYLGKIFCLKDNKKIISFKYIIINICIFNILSLYYSYIGKNLNISNEIMGILKFLLAIYGSLLSMSFFIQTESKLNNCVEIKFLSEYTFPIYLMHTMFSACTRILLLKMKIYNFEIHFATGLFMGIVGPIIASKLLEKTKYGEFILYPVRFLKKAGNKKY